MARRSQHAYHGALVWQETGTSNGALHREDSRELARLGLNAGGVQRQVDTVLCRSLQLFAPLPAAAYVMASQMASAAMNNPQVQTTPDVICSPMGRMLLLISISDSSLSSGPFGRAVSCVQPPYLTYLDSVHTAELMPSKAGHSSYPACTVTQCRI